MNYLIETYRKCPQAFHSALALAAIASLGVFIIGITHPAPITVALQHAGLVAFIVLASVAGFAVWATFCFWLVRTITTIYLEHHFSRRIVNPTWWEKSITPRIVNFATECFWMARS